MCGRIRQAGDGEQYMETLNWNPRAILNDVQAPKFNVPPGTRPLTLHRLGDGSEQVERMFWGYKPAWYKRGPASNARLDTVLNGSPFWLPLLTRRILVPAEGWYEWIGEKTSKQPWYIHAKNDAPILMAAIAAWSPGAEMNAAHGFAIVTDDAAGGMVDIHDRRPIVLAPEDALAWLDPATRVEDALAMLTTPRPESAFVWHPVTPAMGNSRYQLADASEPF
ncbi:hypothetical protein CR155_05075 [Pollutimonas nitritireducens]|uniref:Abasic site processing protein n=2 Tax=Pollutimonas nitritireducens TaxID=2045209 RepID=A0A2N4UJ75_9BURK|nr:hypothetical protein CR155_05075 [Pollutimonas nitritireducens]